MIKTIAGRVPARGLMDGKQWLDFVGYLERDI